MVRAKHWLERSYVNDSSDDSIRLVTCLVTDCNSFLYPFLLNNTELELLEQCDEVHCDLVWCPVQLNVTVQFDNTVSLHVALTLYDILY